MENKAFLVINAIVNKAHASEVPGYLGSIMPVFGKNGGKPVARYRATDQLSGQDGPEMVAIVEFPDSATINNMVNSEDYKSLDELRGKVFTKLNLVICDEL